MIRSYVGKYGLITFKILLIMLMLNLSTVFLFGHTTAAVDTITGEYVPESGGFAASDDIGGANVSAGIDPIPASTSKPADAKVIVLPNAKGTTGDSKKDDKAAPDDVNSSNRDAAQGGASSQAGTGAAGASNASNPMNSAGKGSLFPNENAENPAGSQQGLPGLNSQGSAGNSGDLPASDAAVIVLVQADIDKVYRHEGEKVAYLTFDDGPFPSQTSAILDILKEEDVKATFFMIGSNAERYPEMVRRQYEEGHGIGNHTYSHVFKQIYSSPESYIDDLTRSEQVLKSILGEDKEFKLTRFPGGSFGKALAPYRQAVNEAGYLYVDWNSLNGDAETSKILPAKRLVERLKETVYGQSGLIVLMHDAPNKQTTVEALPEIIHYLKSENYRFELLPGSR